MPNIFLCVSALLNFFELLLRNYAIAVEYSRTLLKIVYERACFGLWVFAVQLPVRSHTLVNAVATVGHFVVRSFSFKLRSVLFRRIAFYFIRRISYIEYYRLITYNCFLLYVLSLCGRMSEGEFPALESKIVNSHKIYNFSSCYKNTAAWYVYPKYLLTVFHRIFKCTAALSNIYSFQIVTPYPFLPLRLRHSNPIEIYTALPMQHL